MVVRFEIDRLGLFVTLPLNVKLLILNVPCVELAFHAYIRNTRVEEEFWKAALVKSIVVLFPILSEIFEEKLSKLDRNAL